MKHLNYKDVEAEEVEGGSRARIRWLISEKDGAENFALRLFEIEPNGNTPWHQHGWEHENFILEGEGALRTEKGDVKFGPGDVLLVEPMEMHQYRNSGKGTLRLLCLIPLRK
jgi:quercetin dioxygenase-like cupin family protein